MKRIFILIITTILIIVGCTGPAEPPNTEKEYITVSEMFEEAYANTVALENYSMEAEISLRKLVFEANISGIVKKQDGQYTGTAIVKIPGKKYSYTYSSPYDGKDTCTELKSDSGNKYLSFNIANIGEGVICPLPDEIVETGEFTNKSKTKVEFLITNEQASDLYGSMIEYFKTAATDYIDLSDMVFTSGSINVTIEDNKIWDYTVTLEGDSRIGKITCEFSCTII